MTHNGNRYAGYERDSDWDTFSTKEKLNDIVKRLSYISTQEIHKEFRSRYTTEEQYAEEYGPESGYEEMLSYLWFSAKEDYCRYKEIFDTYLEENKQSQHYMNNLEAMRQVIDDEIEATLLGDDETDTNNNQINEEDS